MKKLISILFLTIVTLNAWGVKAYPLPLTITQKDGKQLTFQLHGDENFSYTTTTDGVLLFREGNDIRIKHDAIVRASAIERMKRKHCRSMPLSREHVCTA